MIKGLAVLAAAFLLARLLGETTTTALVAACITLVLLPPSWDPAIILKERLLRNAPR